LTGSDTARVIVNANNQKVWLWDSAPFGDTAANEQPTAGIPNFTFNLRFPGQQYDRETGTHYNYFRDYEAGTGRYVQSDPVGLDDGPNTFSYVGLDPLSFLDDTAEGKRRGGGVNNRTKDTVNNSQGGKCSSCGATVPKRGKAGPYHHAGLHSATIEKIANVVQKCLGRSIANRVAKVLHNSMVRQLCKTCHDLVHATDRKRWGAMGAKAVKAANKKKK